jgi:hypothetical protein
MHSTLAYWIIDSTPRALVSTLNPQLNLPSAMYSTIAGLLPFCGSFSMMIHRGQTSSVLNLIHQLRFSSIILSVFFFTHTKWVIADPSIMRTPLTGLMRMNLLYFITTTQVTIRTTKSLDQIIIIKGFWDNYLFPTSNLRTLASYTFILGRMYLRMYLL